MADLLAGKPALKMLVAADSGASASNVGGAYESNIFKLDTSNLGAQFSNLAKLAAQATQNKPREQLNRYDSVGDVKVSNSRESKRTKKGGASRASRRGLSRTSRRGNNRSSIGDMDEMISAISDPRGDSQDSIKINHLWLPSHKDSSPQKRQLNRPVSKIDKSRADLPLPGPGMGVEKLPPILQDRARHTREYNLQPKNRFMNKKSQEILEKADFVYTDLGVRNPQSLKSLSRKSTTRTRQKSRERKGNNNIDLDSLFKLEENEKDNLGYVDSIQQTQLQRFNLKENKDWTVKTEKAREFINKQIDIKQRVGPYQFRLIERQRAQSQLKGDTRHLLEE